MGYEFGQDAGRTNQPRRTIFEVITKLVLPALLVFAYVVTLLHDERRLAWVLAVLVSLSLAISFSPAAVRWDKIRALLRRDELAARQAFPELRKFVGEFDQFVNRQRGDTLHYVVQSDVSAGHVDAITKLGMPNIDIFASILYNLRERAGKPKPTTVDLKYTNSELNTLIASYNDYCMNAVFELLPQEIRSQLTDRAKRNLEACRERFNEFLNDRSRYVKHFDESFAARYGLRREFHRPKPL